MAAQPERWNARRTPPRLPGPTYPCPRCGVDVASRFRGFRVENLRHVGWQLFMPATTYVNWMRTRAGGHPGPDARRAGYVRAGAGGGALAGWAIRAPHEHDSQMRVSSLPPSRSPQRWYWRRRIT